MLYDIPIDTAYYAMHAMSENVLDYTQEAVTSGRHMVFDGVSYMVYINRSYVYTIKGLIEMSIDLIINDIIKNEGGFVNHKNDKGGATNYGVTQATLSAYRGKQVSVDDVKSLTLAEAREIFKKNYHEKPKINTLPDELHPIMTDMSVHHGPVKAIQILQGVLNDLGYCAGNNDGIIGPMTRMCAKNAVSSDKKVLINAIVGARKSLFRRIEARDKTQGVFLAGWLARADKFLV